MLRRLALGVVVGVAEASTGEEEEPLIQRQAQALQTKPRQSHLSKTQQSFKPDLQYLDQSRCPSQTSEGVVVEADLLEAAGEVVQTTAEVEEDRAMATDGSDRA